MSSSPAPSTPAGNKKAAPKHKVEDEGATIKVASKKETTSGAGSASATGSKPAGIIKLKKPPPKHKLPGNWKEGSFVDQDKKKTSKASVPAPSPSPIVNQLDETARETFTTGRPLEDAPDLQMCKHCKKGVLSVVAKQHIAACLKLKKEKAQKKKEAKEARAREQQAREEEEAAAAAAARKTEGPGSGGGGGGGAGGTGFGGNNDDDSSDSDDAADNKKPGGGARKTATGSAAAGAAAAAAGVASKKRKADTDLDKGGGGPKKKKKEEAKPKTAKPKGPVDIERQCGVILPNGQPCARSLTCKSHSMGAKRAVQGRSLPYDMLLAAYQKKNQAKQQKAAIDATAPVEEEDDTNGAAVDSDEEAASVMSALARWQPQPLVPQPSFAPIRRQYQLARLHEQLQTATNGGRVNIFRVSGYGAQRLPDGHPGLQSPDSEDAPGEPDTMMMMLPPAVPGNTNGTGPGSSSSSSTVTTAIPPPIVSSSTVTTAIPPPIVTPVPPPIPPASSSSVSSPMTANSSATQRPQTISSRA